MWVLLYVELNFKQKIKDLESKLSEETNIKQEQQRELNEVKSKLEVLEKEHETLKHVRKTNLSIYNKFSNLNCCFFIG